MGKKKPKDYVTARVSLYARKLIQIYRGHEGVSDTALISPLVIEFVEAWAREKGVPLPDREEFYREINQGD